MRKIAIPVLSAAILLSLGGCSQMGDWFGGESSQQSSRPMSPGQMTSLAQLTPSQMLGKTVVAYDGQKVGTVQDVVLNRNNRPSQLIVGSGGVLGIGEHNVALKASDARYAPQQDAIVATQLTKDQFAALPEFRYDNSMISLSRQR